MPTPTQNLTSFSFTGQWPLTSPDIAVSGSTTNPSAGGIVDMDTLGSETISELQNLQQDLTNRLTEIPGSNLDFNFTTTYESHISNAFLVNAGAGIVATTTTVTTTAASNP